MGKIKVMKKLRQKAIAESKNRPKNRAQKPENREKIVKSHSMRTVHIWRDGKRTKTPFRSDQKILLVGEGNFSFAVSLVKETCMESGNFLVATCYDSEDILYEKYGEEAKSNVQFLKRVGVSVLFSIDATKLGSYKEIRNHLVFHRIIFHFPHVGMGIKDRAVNIRENQKLVGLFLESASKLLMVASGQVEYKTSMVSGKQAASNAFCHDGIREMEDEDVAEENINSSTLNSEIHVTLKWSDPYKDWNIKTLTSSVEFRESFRFSPDTYPGYEHRRTLGFQEGKSLHNNEEISKCECKTFVFQLARVSKEIN